MAKAYKLTESDVPERRAQSLYADIAAGFIAQGMKPATLRAGPRRALKDKEAEGARPAQRGGGTVIWQSE
jgi:hypothetical protein